MFLTSTREIDWLTALFFYAALDVAWATSLIMSLQDLASSLQMAQHDRPDYLARSLEQIWFPLSVTSEPRILDSDVLPLVLSVVVTALHHLHTSPHVLDPEHSGSQVGLLMRRPQAASGRAC